MSTHQTPVLTLTRERLTRRLNSFERCEWRTVIAHGSREVSSAIITADRIYRAFGYCEIHH